MFVTLILRLRLENRPAATKFHPEKIKGSNPVCGRFGGFKSEIRANLRVGGKFMTHFLGETLSFCGIFLPWPRITIGAL